MRSACPHCDKAIHPNAMLCPHCQSLLVEFEERSRWPVYFGFGLLFVLVLAGAILLFQYTGDDPVVAPEERQAIDPALVREQEEARKLQERRKALLERIEEGKRLSTERKQDQEAWKQEGIEKKQAFLQDAYAEFDQKATKLQARLIRRGEYLIENGAPVAVQEKIETLLEEMDLINAHVERMLVLSGEGEVDKARVILDSARDRYKRFSLDAERFLLNN
jgi:predicted nucleic acid-binding Zn ribbon protein